ncbi:putative PurR-regulated permease PerM [Deinobacterium chartae]|uniref:Putative PurR-regulated permease PerM n=1 Tax=Deinobacterium chartae TaxID=521158 RepID=A0A841I7A7_9DEIO|nr:AI-2E family transporter [Deinobacterium chartae]MBB6099762.1 putative PurR-regulated permease PerM [Deinobacterium chartae]
MGEGNAFVQVWRNPYIRVVVLVLLIYLVYRLAGMIAPILILAALAYTLAYLVNPLLNWFERRRIPRGVGVLLVFLLLAGMLTLASVLFVTVLAQLSELFQQLPALFEQANDLWQRWWGILQSYRSLPMLQGVSEQITEFVQSSVSTLSDSALKLVQGALSQGGAVIGGLASVASGVTQFVLMLILSVYMMLDFNRIGVTLLSVFPRRSQPLVLELSSHINTAVGGYLRGQILIATGVGTITGVGLAIFGIPSAAALGFLAGIFNIVPYLGVVIAIVPAILLALSVAPIKILFVLIVFLIASQVESHFLSPMILGRTTNLHPVTVLLSILIGVSLLGLPGALLGVPAAALGKLLLQSYYYPSRFYRQLARIRPPEPPEPLPPLEERLVARQDGDRSNSSS